MSWKATAFVKEICDNITQSEKLTLLVLADYHNTVRKVSWPSLPELAQECLVTESGLCRILKRLEEKSFIVRVRGGGRGKRAEYSFVGLDTNTDLKRPFNSETLTPEDVNTDRNTDPPANAIRKEPVKEPVSTKTSPPSSEKKVSVDPRTQEFRNTIQEVQKVKTKEHYPWDARQGSQLKAFLKRVPGLGVVGLRKWLENYWASENINPADPPWVYLPKLERFRNSPLDQYGKPLNRPAPSAGEDFEGPGAKLRRQLGK